MYANTEGHTEPHVHLLSVAFPAVFNTLTLHVNETATYSQKHFKIQMGIPSLPAEYHGHWH